MPWCAASRCGPLLWQEAYYVWLNTHTLVLAGKATCIRDLAVQRDTGTNRSVCSTSFIPQAGAGALLRAAERQRDVERVSERERMKESKRRREMGCRKRKRKSDKQELEKGRIRDGEGQK